MKNAFLVLGANEVEHENRKSDVIYLQGWVCPVTTYLRY